MKTWIALILAMLCAFTVQAKTVTLRPSGKDDTKRIQKTIDRLPKNESNILVFLPGTYRLSRAEATQRLLHVSNTSREHQVPVRTKHIGMLFEGFRNLTVKGEGAEFITFGEMTPWVISNCRDTRLEGFTIDADDPTVTEMTVTEASDSAFAATVEPKSKYELRNGRLFWKGHGWEFDKGHAQMCDTVEMVTKNIPCPLNKYSSVEEPVPGKLMFRFPEPYSVKPGWTIQMRHTIRNEVGGLIVDSENTLLHNIKVKFIGNFGIVGQNSRTIGFDNVDFRPSEGRTNCGFADFIHISGCSGHISFVECNFNGSQDDPINVHGTVMKLEDRISERRVRLGYGHPETYGFPIFAAGDSVEFKDRDRLLPVFSTVVEEAAMDGDHAMLLTLRDEVPEGEGLVVENVTATPSVYVGRCRFELTPTRGILVTTRKRVVIEDNVFVNTPMPAILIADDARSWYESGRVEDVTIRNNDFLGCGWPTIKIAPEVKGSREAVHSGISIFSNRFTGPSGIEARNTAGLAIGGNIFEDGSKFQFTDCTGLKTEQ